MQRAPSRRRLLAGLLCALGVVLLPAANGFGHHGVATARVGTGEGWSSTASVEGTSALPRLSAGLTYHTAYFSRVQRGDTRSEIDLGAVLINTATLGLQLELRSRTALNLRLPAGVVSVRTGDDGPHTHTGGFGDMTLAVQQQLLPLPRRAGEVVRGGARVTLRGGLMLPTGRYEPESQLSVTEVEADERGGIGVVTYNTQASLGADTWFAHLGVGARWPVHERVGILTDVGTMIPLTRTRDDLRWGLDVSAQLAAETLFAGGALRLTTGVEFRHHAKDSVRRVEGAPGVSEYERLGGRKAAAVLAGIGGELSARTRCEVGLRVPFWQRVGGVQLLETMSGSLGCALSWGL